MADNALEVLIQGGRTPAHALAMMIPEVTSWARKRGSDAAKFLLPLSYGAIFGGILTVIGTSTNLVVAGQMEDFDLEPFGFFELGMVGLPISAMSTPYSISGGSRRDSSSPPHATSTTAASISATSDNQNVATCRFIDSSPNIVCASTSAIAAGAHDAARSPVGPAGQPVTHRRPPLLCVLCD